MILQRRQRRILASPRARRAMRERGMDPASIRGTGPGGRIVEADVRRASLAVSAVETFGRASAGSEDPRRARVGHVSNVPLSMSTLETCSTRGRPSVERPAGSGGPRRALSGTLSFWLQATVDVTSVLEIRGQIAEEVQRACGTPLRLADFLLRGMALALADCPQVNYAWQGETRIGLKSANVGFEVDVPGGRAVPVIRDGNRLHLMEFVSRRAELTAAARAGRLPPDAAGEVATSLCDLTDYRVDRYAAVLTPPCTSVVAVGCPAPALWCGLPTTPQPGPRPGPKVSLGAKETFGRASAGSGDPRRARQSLCITMTADQRALAPQTAAAFLDRIVELLENPFLLLCERLSR